MLDLGWQPRMNTARTTEIAVHEKEARQVERLMIVTTTKLWGWDNDTLLNPRRRVRIACAMCQQVAYNHEYEHPIIHYMILKWELSLQNAVINGSENVANDIQLPQVGGSK